MTRRSSHVVIKITACFVIVSFCLYQVSCSARVCVLMLAYVCVRDVIVCEGEACGWYVVYVCVFL